MTNANKIRSCNAAMVIVLSAVFVALMSACATTPQIPPEECANSLIYKVADEMHTTPQAVGAVFQLADLELVKNDVVAKKDVSQFLDDVESLVSRDTTTYLDVVTAITVRVEALQEKFGPEVMLLITVFSEQLSEPIPIDPCDKTLLLKHVADQRRVLEML